MKKLLSILLIIAFTGNITAMAATEEILKTEAIGVGFDGTISAVTGVDTAEGIVQGEKANYYLYLPKLWQGYTTIVREKLTLDSIMLEKLNFFYIPQSKLAKPVFLLSLAVYDKNDWDESDDFEKLLESKNYVFAIKPSNENNLTNPTDRSIYNLFLEQIKNYDYLREIISLPAGDEKILENTIWANGRLLKDISIRKDDKLYIPLREACEKMDFTIKWATTQRTAAITKGGFYYLLMTEDPSSHRGFNMIYVDDKIYVSSMFFLHQLKADVEIDEFNNVRLNSE